MQNIALSIQGMNCGHCVKAVQQALGTISGISSSEVKVGSATISFDESQTSFETIRKAIEEEGYKVAAS